MITDIFNNKQAFIDDTTGENEYASVEKLHTLDFLCKYINRNNIQGDVVELGVYRGTTVLYMAKLFYKRNVWAFDSYAGIQPAEDAPYKELAQTAGGGHYAASLESVQANFHRYFEWPARRIRFVKGYFSETLPCDELKKIAVLRMDSDTYSSTLEILYNLYDKVIPGGVIIADDFKVEGCYMALKRWASEQPKDIVMYHPRCDRGKVPVIDWMNRDTKKLRRGHSGAWWIKDE